MLFDVTQTHQLRQGARELTVGKVASLGRVWKQFFSSQAVSSRKKSLVNFKMAYSSLDEPYFPSALVLPDFGKMKSLTVKKTPSMSVPSMISRNFKY